MSRNYTDEQVDKMMENILNNEKLKNKMLKDFGFDIKEYSFLFAYASLSTSIDINFFSGYQRVRKSYIPLQSLG